MENKKKILIIFALLFVALIFFMLSSPIKMIPGVVETGFFIGLTDIAFVGTVGAVEKIEKLNFRRL